MGFPPHFLDELRARVTLSEVIAPKVTWDARRSTPARGDWWAPCPFHQEKTASFHVDDRKGFYHCFGCQASGDAITFVKESEGVGFPEAVERLAAQAGLELPQRETTPEMRRERDRRAALTEAMETALRAYRRAFRSGAGTAARAYAERRGLRDATLVQFEIGYAPDARQGLAQIFRETGTLDLAVEAGLLARPEGGGAPYDRFRDRLIFPIRDPRGRLIAFGGRALNPEARAKYLNSPETPLFKKGQTLYNHGPARAAAAKSGRLVVAEGYMDVIALAQAGIAEAVAPLGTAVTEAQLAHLWAMALEPVLALDGDAAGLRAAHRVADLALPLLAPGKSLAFCLMPQGQDPDDLVKAGGVAAMEEALGQALPLVELLWRRESAAGPLDTPERRAGLKARLDAAVAKIRDGELARLYRDSLARRMREHFWQLDRPGPQGASRGAGPAGSRRGGRPRRGAEGAQLETKASALARGGASAPPARARGATILALAMAHPGAADPEALEAMPLAAAFEPVRAALLTALDAGDPAAARAADPEGTVARVRRPHPYERPESDPAEVALVLREAIARHVALSAREAELAEAGRSLAEAEGEDWTWRVRDAGARCVEVDQSALRAEEAAEADTSGSRVAEIYARHAGTSPKKTPPASSNQ